MVPKIVINIEAIVIKYVNITKSSIKFLWLFTSAFNLRNLFLSLFIYTPTQYFTQTISLLWHPHLFQFYHIILSNRLSFIILPFILLSFNIVIFYHKAKIFTLLFIKYCFFESFFSQILIMKICTLWCKFIIRRSLLWPSIEKSSSLEYWASLNITSWQTVVFLRKWIIRSPCPHCPEIGNRKSVFKETAIPVVETFIINPLECNHAPKGVNTFKGGHDYDQVSRDSQT